MKALSLFPGPQAAPHASQLERSLSVVVEQTQKRPAGGVAAKAPGAGLGNKASPASKPGGLGLAGRPRGAVAAQQRQQQVAAAAGSNLRQQFAVALSCNLATGLGEADCRAAPAVFAPCCPPCHLGLPAGRSSATPCFEIPPWWLCMVWHHNSAHCWVGKRPACCPLNTASAWLASPAMHRGLRPPGAGI